MVCIVCSTPKSPDKSGFKLHTMAKNGVQDSVHGCRVVCTNDGTHK